MNLVTGLWGMNVNVPGQFADGLGWFFGVSLDQSFFISPMQCHSQPVLSRRSTVPCADFVSPFPLDPRLSRRIRCRRSLPHLQSLRQTSIEPQSPPPRRRTDYRKLYIHDYL